MPALPHTFAGLVVLAALAIGESPAVHAQDRVTVPGTSVTLTPPPGFTLSRTTRGLENAATRSNIAIAEREAEAYAELATRFASPKSLSAGYASQGVTIRSVRSLSIDGKQVPFAVGSQSTNNQQILKYLALIQGDKTVLLTFTIADRSLSEADVEAVVRSITLTPAPTLAEQLATLPFVFTAAEPFRVRNVRARASVTLTATDGPPTEQTPVIIIATGPSQALMGEEQRLAVELLRSTGGFRDAEITAQEPTAVGYRIVATVGERSVVQYLRILAGGTYLRLMARGPSMALMDAEAAITAIAESLAPR